MWSKKKVTFKEMIRTLLLSIRWKISRERFLIFFPLWVTFVRLFKHRSKIKKHIGLFTNVTTTCYARESPIVLPDKEKTLTYHQKCFGNLRLVLYVLFILAHSVSAVLMSTSYMIPSVHWHLSYSYCYNINCFV